MVPHVHGSPLDPSPLLDPTLISGYRHVYRKGSRWEAIVRVFCPGDFDVELGWTGRGYLKHLGCYKTPREAAQAVAYWFHDRYGGEWIAVERVRCRWPFQVKYSDRLKRHLVVAYVMGSSCPTVVAMLDPWTSRNRKQAIEAGRAVLVDWLRREFGLFAGVSLWRSESDGQRHRAGVAKRVVAIRLQKRNGRYRGERGRFMRPESKTPPLPLFVDSGFPSELAS